MCADYGDGHEVGKVWIQTVCSPADPPPFHTVNCMRKLPYRSGFDSGFAPCLVHFRIPL